MNSLRVMAILEAETVSGPAKNLLRFCERVRATSFGLQRIEMTLATFVRGRETNAFVEEARGRNIPVDVMVERGRFDRGVLQEMRRVIDVRCPDILQTHAVKSNFLMRWGGIEKDVRWLAFHHGYTAEDLKVKLYNQLNRWSLRKARRVVTVCRPFAVQLEATGLDRDRIDILPNAIEEFQHPEQEVVEALRRECGWQSGERVLLTVGRLSREKGPVYLVQALERLNREAAGLRWRAVVVGDGPERNNLEAAIQAAGLREKVYLAGHRKDVRPFFKLADLFVLSSLSEGSPNVILEAMAAGLPIVSTAAGGVPETVIDEESALLSAPGDGAALGANLVKMMVDTELAGRLVQGARQRLSHFTPEAYEASLRDIYSRVMAG